MLLEPLRRHVGRGSGVEWLIMCAELGCLVSEMIELLNDGDSYSVDSLDAERALDGVDEGTEAEPSDKRQEKRPHSADVEPSTPPLSAYKAPTHSNLSLHDSTNYLVLKDS